MGVLDKLINTMHFSEDYDNQDFLDDPDEDDFEEEKPKKNRFFRSSSTYDDSLDDDDDDYEAYEEPKYSSRSTAKKTTASSAKSATKSKTAKSSTSSTSTGKSSSKVSSIHSRNIVNGMAVCVICPKSMEDGKEITDTLLAGCAVILNMEKLDKALSQRIIDYSCGSCFAINGNLQKIGNSIFIVTPSTVELSGDFQAMMNSTFDFSNTQNLNF